MQGVHVYLVFFALVFAALGFLFHAFYFEGRRLRSFRSEIERLEKALSDRRRGVGEDAGARTQSAKRRLETASEPAEKPRKEEKVPVAPPGAGATPGDAGTRVRETTPAWRQRLDGILDLLDERPPRGTE